MHDIKSIRKNPDFYIKKFSQRNVNFDINITNIDAILTSKIYKICIIFIYTINILFKIYLIIT